MPADGTTPHGLPFGVAQILRDLYRDPRVRAGTRSRWARWYRRLVMHS